MGGMLIFAVALSVVLLLIDKFMMYHAPEDDELWVPGKEHFTMVGADKRYEKLMKEV
jgi:hypothetical protein